MYLHHYPNDKHDLFHLSSVICRRTESNSFALFTWCYSSTELCPTTICQTRVEWPKRCSKGTNFERVNRRRDALIFVVANVQHLESFWLSSLGALHFGPLSRVLSISKATNWTETERESDGCIWMNLVVVNIICSIATVLSNASTLSF